jgi:hypothetical protein
VWGKLKSYQNFIKIVKLIFAKLITSLDEFVPDSNSVKKSQQNRKKTEAPYAVKQTDASLLCDESASS